jgi:hypothetical protein
MHAEEAKAIADKKRAVRTVSAYLVTIKTVAESGEYETSFGRLDAKESEALKLLGFTVEALNGGGTAVRWGNVRH